MLTFAEKQEPTQKGKSASLSRSKQPLDRQSREAGNIPQLQRTIGNQGVQRYMQVNSEECGDSLLTSATSLHGHNFSQIPVHSCRTVNVQPKLMVGTHGDIYEQEADRTAAQVMNIRNLDTSQPVLREMSSEKKEADVQTNPLAASISPLVQGEMKQEVGAEPIQTKLSLPRAEEEGGAFESSNWPETQLSSSKDRGAPLPDEVRTFMEPRFGADFSQVRVHADEAAARKTSALYARAFTRGPDIFFNRGQFAPEMPAGRQLIAHELTHVVQQSRLPSGDGVGLPVQCESMISDNELFLFVNQDGGNGFGFHDLVRAVQRRYRLDRTASWMLASWLNERHRVFYNRRDRRYDQRFRVDMPRAVAFFIVDWIEPFNPFSRGSRTGSQFRIDSAAFDHAQEIWARENVFVGFRRGRGMTDPALRQVQFQAATNSDLTPRLNSPSDLNLLAQRPSGALPPGFFHIMVTGSTTESASAAGKSVRSSARQPVTDASQGVILFAEVYAREGYRQRVGATSTEPELGELLSHEIGHFLFGLSHSDLVYDPATGGFTDVQRRGIMQQGHTGLVGSEERFSAESRRDINEAFRTGGVIPQPQRPTSR